MAEKVDRLTRVNELIKRELANYLEKFPVEAAENMLVSITEVNTSVDLRNATVSISIFGGKNSNRAEIFKERYDRTALWMRCAFLPVQHGTVFVPRSVPAVRGVQLSVARCSVFRRRVHKEV